MKFVASPELNSAVNALNNSELSQQKMKLCHGSVKLNWQGIATAAGFQISDLAEAIVYQIF